MADSKDTFHWQVDPRAKPLQMDSDEFTEMTRLLEFKYERVLEQSMRQVNQTADNLYHHATYSFSTSAQPQSPIEHVVSRLSYKPNTRLWVEGNHMLVMAMDCPDRDNPKSTVPVVSRQQIPAKYACGEGSTEEMVDWVRNCLRQLEEHEMDEWLRLDKKLVNDPHRAEIRLDWGKF